MRLDPRTVAVGTAPAVEPISTAEAKDHLRVDISADDDYIDALISTARHYCEQATGRAFVNQTLTGGLTAWPWDDVIMLPYAPLVSVTSIAYVDTSNNSANVTSSVYGVDTKRNQIYLAQDQVWPSTQLRTYDPITITWVAGYGSTATTIPDIYKHAIKLLIGHWYENREQIIALQGIGVAQLPLAVQSLLSIDRAWY